MNDIDLIRNLAYHYAELNDTGDFDGLGDLLAHAEVTRHRDGVNSASMRGREGIATFYKDHVRLYENRPHTRHVITNLIVEVASDGRSAAARSYFMVLQCLADFPLQIITSGRYHDRFEKTAELWQFTHKTIYVDYSGDLSRHAKPTS
jgi:hypothetical protein